MRHAMIGDHCTNCGVERRWILDVPCMPENKAVNRDMRAIEVTTRQGGTTDADIREREMDKIKTGQG